MSKAELIYRFKHEGPDDEIVEMVIWRLPSPVPPSVHPLKYRLFYGRNGERIVGYDNERGKGDHKHIRDLELPYVFVDVDQLIADFKADIRKERGES